MPSATDSSRAPLVSRAPEVRETCLSLGNHRLILRRTPGGGVLRLVGADGVASVEVEVTPSGPLLRLRSGLSIAVDGPLSLEADTIALHGRRGVGISSGDGIELRAAGDLRADAAAHTLVAHQGDVALRANDDVRLNGERVKLNC